MGKRVHVAKTYKVEYGSTEAFNWSDDKFYAILGTLGAEPNNVGAPDDALADVFECPKEKYEDALRNLVVYIHNPELFGDADTLKYELEQLDVTAEWLLETMQAYYNEADMSDGWLHFASW